MIFKKKKKMTNLKKAEKIVSTIDISVLRLGELMQEAKSRKEADAIFGEIQNLIIAGDEIAQDTWDWVIDWDKVKWAKEKKKVKEIV